MEDNSPIGLYQSKLNEVIAEDGGKPTENVVTQLDNVKQTPRTPISKNVVKNKLDLDVENKEVESVTKNDVDVNLESNNLKAKLDNHENLKTRKKVAVLKKKYDEKNLKKDSDEKSPKCVGKEKVSREKVAKLTKKFEKGDEDKKYSKVFGLFRKSQLNADAVVVTPKSREKSPTKIPKSPIRKAKSPNSHPGSPTNLDKQHDEVVTVTFDDGYVNNYKSNGIRAKEAEVNRKKKLMESKGLLNQVDLYEDDEMKRTIKNSVLLRKASKKISQAMLNKPKSVDIPSVFGSYPVLISTSYVILFIFLAQLILNKVSFNGRCVSKVVYPERTLNKKPYHVIFGYGACEYNLNQKVETIGFLGKSASDNGWPSSLVSDEGIVESISTFDSPNYRIFNLFGSLDANYIRNYKEHFRLFWSMFMHSGLIHLVFNLIGQTQILWIIEPDWGFFRTMSTFLLSGFVGNLSAAVFEPSFNVVGSSGCMFGLIASLIPYCIENWTLLSSPIYILVFSVVITIISLSVFNSTVSIYSHFGGWIGGFLWGFATLRTSFMLKDCAIKESVLLSPMFRSKLTPETRIRLKQSYQTKLRKCVDKIRTSEKKEKKFMQKLKKVYMYPVEYFKRGPYDILIRLVPLITLIVVIVLLCCYLFIESLYSKHFLLDESSKLSQCCYLNTKGEPGFVRKVFWCFENFETAKNFCKTTTKKVVKEVVKEVSKEVEK